MIYVKNHSAVSDAPAASLCTARSYRRRRPAALKITPCLTNRGRRLPLVHKSCSATRCQLVPPKSADLRRRQHFFGNFCRYPAPIVGWNTKLVGRGTIPGPGEPFREIGMGRDFGIESNGDTNRELVRGAQYVRMSTEHQRYSTGNQTAAMQLYAKQRGIEVVRTYADEGKSGLRIDGRDALKKLIGDVQGGTADFPTILVYDVSRWGRFQDADESAYYEYICKRAGISVQYCAEQFENDGSPVSTIVKGVKRAMVGEYSRELSLKVFAGQCRLTELGFRQGGPAGFGLRRCLIDQAGAAKCELSRGEHKSIQTDRVVLVPWPA